MDTHTFYQVLWFLGIAMGLSLIVALVGLALIINRIRQLAIPTDADFFTTMHHVPFLLVLLLDLLDFALDIFSAPIVWIALDRMGLARLRNIATIEALIPVSNVLPTFTIAWLAARWFNLGSRPDTRYTIDDQ